MDYLGSLGLIEKTAGECVSIACGAKHTLALTDRGEIFVFGDGREGVLGQGDEVSWPMPKLVDYLATPAFLSRRSGVVTSTVHARFSMDRDLPGVVAYTGNWGTAQ